MSGENTEQQSSVSDRVAQLAFICSLLAGAFLYGMFSVIYGLPPYPQLSHAYSELKNVLEGRPAWYQFREDRDRNFTRHSPGSMMPGLTLVSAFTDGDEHSVKIIDSGGRVIQDWKVGWDHFWPDPRHLPEEALGWSEKHLHGVVIADNGDLVLNFTELAMMRLNGCGEEVWRLEKRAHHSIDLDDDGGFWVPGLVLHTEKHEKYRNHEPDFYEFTAMKVSAEGEVLEEISINDLLIANGRSGYLYLSSLDELMPVVTGDTLHLNDLEVFPTTMQEGVFRHGDILASLRNINTILVFDPDTLEIRFINTGAVMRQHDPDFVDGNTISVFDNNNMLDEWFDNASGERNTQDQNSRIVTISAETGRITDVYEGGEGGGFFTDLMGQHQWLENGNLLIAESRAGRLLEVARGGGIVWEYFNIIEPGMLGAITYAERLPMKYNEAFFEQARAGCNTP